MGKFVFFVFWAAVLFLSQCVTAERDEDVDPLHPHRGNCFPDNATKVRCFADYPNYGHKAKNWMAHFMPQQGKDSYVFNGTTTLDMKDFTISTIEEDPKYICQTKDRFVASLHCLATSVRIKCPSLPDSMTDQYTDFAEGLTYICSRIDEMDSVCIHTHFESMEPCQKIAEEKMKQDFDKLARDHDHHKSDSHVSSGSNTTSSARNSTPSTDKDWSHGVRNVTYNSTIDDSMSEIGLVKCRFDYVMLQCVKDRVASCHSKTAQIMHNVTRRMMTSPQCQAKMAEWETAHVMEHVTDCHDDHCGAAWCLSAPWQGLLLCLLLVFVVTAKL